jgi:hypothetical protein
MGRESLRIPQSVYSVFKSGFEPDGTRIEVRSFTLESAYSAWSCGELWYQWHLNPTFSYNVRKLITLLLVFGLSVRLMLMVRGASTGEVDGERLHDQGSALNREWHLYPA